MWIGGCGGGRDAAWRLAALDGIAEKNPDFRHRTQSCGGCCFRIRLSSLPMYERFFNFRAKPFAMNPDPAFLYRSRQHEAALTMLEYAIESQAPFCLLTGEIGSGKTTVLRQLIRMLGEDCTVGLISNTHERFHTILPWALSALSIAPSDDSE